MYGLIKLAAKVGSDYYPEIMGNTFIINAPYVFSGVWAVCKGFLDEKTRNKFKIIGSGFKPTLLEFIDEANLPSFIGGKCTCAEFGGCIAGNQGPWNNYEIVKPKGVKPRTKFHPDVNGRCIFHDENGNPILTIKQTEHELHQMVSATNFGGDINIEESKEQTPDHEGFFDAAEGTDSGTPSAESMQIL